MGAVTDYGYDSGGRFKKRGSDGKKTKAYNTWIDVMRRCYNIDWKDKYETYKGVWLCEEWHDFQVFAEWFHANYMEGYQIDKDILSLYYGGSFYYSPKTCRMIPRDLNLLLTNRKGKSRNTDLPLGVSLNKVSSMKPYTAWCNDGKGKTLNLGSSATKEGAFSLYKNFKDNLIKAKAGYYKDENVIDEVLYTALMEYEVTPYPER